MTTLNKDLAAVQLSQVIEQLNNLEDYELIAIHNDYCEVNNDSYNHIIDNDDDEAIDNMFNTPSEAIIAASFGDYNHSHYYFILNGYGNLVSFNYITDDNCPIDTSELAQWLIDEDKLGDYDITVTTLDDILASIEDNITDDNVMLSKLADYLGQSLNSEQVEQLKTDDEYYDYLVSHFINELDDYSYNDLYDLINTVGINY